MDPTPVMTVHARTAAARSGRRAGVGRALAVLVTGLIVAVALLPGPALGAKPSSLPTEPGASPTLPPGQQKKQTPVPVPTPAPATSLPAAPPAAPAVITPAPVPANAAPTEPTESGGSAGSGDVGAPTGTGGSSGDTAGPSGAPDAGDPAAAPAEESAPPADEVSAGIGSASDGGSSGSLTDGSPLSIALGGGLVAGLVGGIVLVLAARRRHPDPQPRRAVAAVPEPVDHEQLLAEALGTRTRRRAVLMDDDRRPAWLRRLEPTAGHPVFHDPDSDDTF